MDTLIFGLKLLTIPEAMSMSLVDIDIWYGRAAAWHEQRERDADKAAKRRR